MHICFCFRILHFCICVMRCACVRVAWSCVVFTCCLIVRCDFLYVFSVFCYFFVLAFSILYFCFLLFVSVFAFCFFAFRCVRARCLIMRCVCVLLDLALWFSLYVFCFLLFFCPCISILYFCFLLFVSDFAFCFFAFSILHFCFYVVRGAKLVDQCIDAGSCLLCGTKRLFAAHHRTRITWTSTRNNVQNVNQAKIT